MQLADCRHTEGPGHDCVYVDWRNSKINAAANIAREAARAAGQYFAGGQVEGKGIEVFHERMAALCGTPNWDCRGTRARCCVPVSDQRFMAVAA